MQVGHPWPTGMDTIVVVIEAVTEGLVAFQDIQEDIETVQILEIEEEVEVVQEITALHVLHEVHTAEIQARPIVIMDEAIRLQEGVPDIQDLMEVPDPVVL